MTARTTVAVTGASGFIGRHLVRAFVEAGHDVRVLLRRPLSSSAPSPVTAIVGSLADPLALEQFLDGADVVIHGAGATKALSRAHFFQINAEGTARLAGLAAQARRPPRFIYISSLAARAPHLSPYAASKRAGEEALAGHAARLPTTIVRPPAVYGPGDLETLRILRMAARGVLLAPRGDEARMSLVHVADVPQFLLAVMAAPGPHSSPLEFDDGTPNGYRWADLAYAAAAALGRPVRLVDVPAFAVRLIGAAASARAQIMRRPSVLSWSKVPELLHPDWLARPQPLAGYVPRFNAALGLRNTVEWAASQGLLRMLRAS